MSENLIPSNRLLAEDWWPRRPEVHLSDVKKVRTSSYEVVPDFENAVAQDQHASSIEALMGSATFTPVL